MSASEKGVSLSGTSNRIDQVSGERVRHGLPSVPESPLTPTPLAREARGFRNGLQETCWHFPGCTGGQHRARPVRFRRWSGSPGGGLRFPSPLPRECYSIPVDKELFIFHLGAPDSRRFMNAGPFAGAYHLNRPSREKNAGAATDYGLCSGETGRAIRGENAGPGLARYRVGPKQYAIEKLERLRPYSSVSRARKPSKRTG